MSKPLLRALQGEPVWPPPVWLMRQAGRYLPEYRAVRASVPDFIALCTTPALAAEVTLQPIRRFGFDAAILFSDILILPWSLGQGLEYREGEGPVLPPIRDEAAFRLLDPSRLAEKTAPVMETIRQVRSGLTREGFAATALIGFAGAPFTVACYMIEGAGSREFAATRTLAWQNPSLFDRIIDLVTETTVTYLKAQVEAGAETLMLFDTWAGILAPSQFRRFVIEPAHRIVTALREQFPGLPVLGFPRMAGLSIAAYATETGVSAVGLDTGTDLTQALALLPRSVAAQGNLDPLAVVAGGSAMARETTAILAAMRGRPYIFNLGHGVVPQTPPEHVAALIDWFVRPKVAIVLFNLGGPDNPEAIRPFLLNLFNDPAILRVPFFVRPFLARKIASARLQPATAAYRLLGGKSPLTEMTQAQAKAIEAALPELDAKCFVAMRYWHPFSLAAARAVKAWQPDEVVLLPLYPQYSTTTTGSSLTAWRDAAARTGLVAPTSAVCCFPTDPAFIAATLSIVRTAYEAARATLDPAIPLRILFSAHGLPEAIVRAGDPYQFHIEQTVAALLAAWRRNDLDWKICYQSRATPQQWIAPSTDTEVAQAGRDKTAVLVVPIAFVSEHSETLVELDVDYKELAHRGGVPGYFRVPTQQLDPGFILSLVHLVRFARGQGVGLHAACDTAACAGRNRNCPFAMRLPLARTEQRAV